MTDRSTFETASIARLMLALVAALAIGAARAAPTRPYTFDEMLQMQSVAPSRFSADGRFLSVWTTRVEMFPDPVSRSESRIYDAQAGELYSITLPAARGLVFGPWSPSGHRLILYGYAKPRDGAENAPPEVALGVWDAASRTYHELPRPVHSDGFARAEDAQWIGDDAVLYVLRRPSDRIEEAEARIREWRKARAGKEPTSSALDSGPPILPAGEPTGRLVQIQLSTGEAKMLYEGVILSFHPAPDGRGVAVLNAGAAIAPTAEKQIDTESFWDSLTLIDLTGKRAPVRMSGDLDVYHHHYLTGFLFWSPDSSRFSFYGHDVGQSIGTSRPYVYDVMSGRYRTVRTGALKLVVPVFNSGFAVAPVHWLRGAPVVLTPGNLPRGADASSPGPAGCWQLSADKEPVRVAVGSGETPEQLLQDGETLLAISRGALWRLTGSGRSQKIYGDDKHLVTGFATAPHRGEMRSVRVQARNGDRTVDAYIDLKSHTLAETGPAPADAQLETYTTAAPDRRLYRKEDLTGTYLILTDGAKSAPKQIFEVNTQLQEIRLSGRRSITYSLPGRTEPLSAWVFTPPDYQPGQRYPVIVQVYAGVTLAPDPNLHYIGTNPQEPFPLITPDLYTSAGYVVMMPSAPLDKDAKPFDMPQQITTAVNAALDKLIADGIADPDRLAIIGHSFMAANTLAILTQSTRFKAAVAWAGVYDFGSWYGTYYSADVMDPLIHHTTVGRAFLLESGLIRLGVAPWQDPDAYVRNSPLYLAGRITTPVLFLHGDADAATPISQSEEMFTALYRQGKEARFVRFWGDDHMLGPANARHAFDEIMRWLETHLKLQGSLPWESLSDAANRDVPITRPVPSSSLAGSRVTRSFWRRICRQPVSLDSGFTAHLVDGSDRIGDAIRTHAHSLPLLVVERFL